MQSFSTEATSSEIATPAELVPIIELLNCRIGSRCVTCVTMPPNDTGFVEPAFLAQLSIVPICDNAAPFDVQFWKNPEGAIIAMQNAYPAPVRYDLTLTAELVRLATDIQYRLTAAKEFAFVADVAEAM